MTKKIFYMMVLICGISLFSSAKQIAFGCIKEGIEKKPACSKKKPAKTKKLTAATIRPFQFYLFNI
ncbi:MAG: hypothetical protein ACXWV6_11280 [Chitinophagaceae bacterium]